MSERAQELRERGNYGGNVREDGFGAEEAWPFYIVCDVSRSMWDPAMNAPNQMTPHEIIKDSMSDMLAQLEHDPTAKDIAHLSIVAFGTNVSEVLPLTSLRGRRTSIPSLPQDGWTDYVRVLEWLGSKIGSDLEKLRDAGYHAKMPGIFFITDGNPQTVDGVQSQDQWLPARRSLDSLEPPLFIAFGLGAVDDDVLQRLASRQPMGAACAAETGGDPSKLLRAIISIIVFSISQSTSRGDFVFRTPSGMRRLPLQPTS